MKKIILSFLLLAASQVFCFGQDKVLYDQDMGPETEIFDPMPQHHELGLKYRERDQNFDEPGGEADWPSRHDDPYPEELIIEVHD